jgi:hypothetical protein
MYEQHAQTACGGRLRGATLPMSWEVRFDAELPTIWLTTFPQCF